MEFGDIKTASKMRDLIERIAGKVVDQKRPEVRIGQVDHYDSGQQVAWILFPGEASDNLVRVRTAMNMLPTKTIATDGKDSADIVRVAGKPGGYYITDYLRGTPFTPGGGTGEPPITPGTTADYWRGDKTWRTLDKTAVGLGNIDNTSDVNKPVSTAQATQLGLKAPLASPAFTGTPTGITKTHVGLGNVDNTSDVNKPVSTAQGVAIALKVALAGTETITGEKAFDLPIGMKQQASAPSVPSTGYAKLFFKQNGRLYVKTPGGEIAIPYGDDISALHANPDFEVSPVFDGIPNSYSEFWGSGGGRKTRTDNTNYLTGSWAAKYTLINGAGAILTADTFTVAGGQLLTVEWYAMSDDPLGQIRLEFMFTSDGSNPVYFGPTTSFINDSWKICGTAGFNRFSTTVQIPAGMTKCTLNWRPQGDAALGTAGIWIDSTSSSIQVSSVDPTPTGVMLPYAGSTAPTGYLLCNGASLLRADYPALFAVIGTTWGSVDSTHFTLPGGAGRFFIGADGTHVLGATGGSTTITATMLPPHAHVITHGHSIATGNTVGSSTAGVTRSTATIAGNSGPPVQDFTGNSGNGPGTSAESLPPWMAGNWIVKY